MQRFVLLKSSKNLQFTLTLFVFCCILNIAALCKILGICYIGLFEILLHLMIRHYSCDKIKLHYIMVELLQNGQKDVNELEKIFNQQKHHHTFKQKKQYMMIPHIFNLHITCIFISFWSIDQFQLPFQLPAEQSILSVYLLLQLINKTPTREEFFPFRSWAGLLLTNNKSIHVPPDILQSSFNYNFSLSISIGSHANRSGAMEKVWCK